MVSDLETDPSNDVLSAFLSELDRFVFSTPLKTIATDQQIERGGKAIAWLSNRQPR